MRLQNFLAGLFSTEGRRAVAENFFSFFFLNAIVALVPLITLPYLVRVLGPSKYGLIAFAQSLTQYFLVLMDYGFNFSASREISICKDDPAAVSLVFNAVQAAKACFLAASFGALALLLAFVPRFGRDAALYLLTFGALAGNLLFPIYLFQGLERVKLALACYGINLAFALLLFVFVRNESDYLRVPLLASSGSILAGLVSLWTARRVLGVSFFLPGPRDVARELRRGWHVFISNVAGASYNNTRVFAMGLFTNDTQTGYYAVAEKLMNFFIVFPVSVMLQAVYPRLSRIFASDREGARRTARQIQNATIAGYLVGIPLLLFFAPRIVALASGRPYPEAVASFRILLVALFFITANAFRLHALLVYGRSDLYAKICLACGAVGSVMTLALTRAFSFYGAAASIVLLSAFALAITVREDRRLTL